MLPTSLPQARPFSLTSQPIAITKAANTAERAMVAPQCRSDTQRTN